MRFFADKIDFPRRQVWSRATTLVIATTIFMTMLGLSRSNAAPSAVSWPIIDLQLIAGGFDGPIDVVSPNDGTNRLFVVERGGFIHIIQDGQRLEDAFLDIQSKVSDCIECGLLGLAFPPDFAQSGYFFINYTNKTNLVDPAPDDNDNIGDQKRGDTVIARLHISGNPNVADASSEEAILIINQPEANHNGGHIFFGPDGYLYIGMGDGGGQGDGFANAQDPQSLHGKILRIQVGPTGTYIVPADNPFVNTPNYRPEIWAMGVRNPWRFNFDPATGDLYVADVGQAGHEEVNYIPAAEIGNGGMNFGWPIFEGNNCYPPDGPQDCDPTGLIAPVTTYTHEMGCSITGGYVYHSKLPHQPPIYLFADYCFGTLSGLQPDGDGWATTQLKDYPFSITSFGEDGDGNIYLVSYRGDIYRIMDPFSERVLIPSVFNHE